MLSKTTTFIFLCSFLPLAWTNWMYLGMVGPHHSVTPPEMASEQSSMCSSVPGLVMQQQKVCQAHPAVIKAVSSGAKRGIHECQNQFRHDRWNCTIEGGESVFDHTLQRGSRETAFIYAITSAGATHAVTQACSAGNLTDCSCDTSRQGQSMPEGWKWGGCSDNVRYGMMFARQFVDAPERAERKRDVRALMNLHNNNAGRLAIARQMELKCRCHGVSGSCELKTCWNKLPSFEQVGHFLKSKYDNSIQVSLKAKRRLRRRGKVKRKVPVQKEDLVHIHRSPNYCIEDFKRGILGTSGRRCNRTAKGPQSCNLLCCGRGYNTQVHRRLERCQCKFHWCCYVKCKTCETMEEIYTCK
ncbi:protein Wnt-16-like precursor [Parasteatoda tepidariorum]|uniref:Protein Wnt n=1 Tax=Parasteatoda tepidariorum TaxID=114398 RepID=Q75PH5_PARTP|nr:protein Wnt-16-like precursor [Parasteatoda tepidariorum]BAD12590.1 Wnt16 like [Parasteatoda tepidariorum]